MSYRPSATASFAAISRGERCIAGGTLRGAAIAAALVLAEFVLVRQP